MNKINLKDKKDELQNLGIEIFDYITGLPQDVRPDTQPRTGVQILLRDVDPTEKNVLTFPVHDPSSRAQFIVCEKSIRTEQMGDATSQNSEDPDSVPADKRTKFRGCITLSLSGGIMLHISVSGLLGSEDVVMAIIIGARATRSSVDNAINNIIRRNGELPKEIFQKEHYLKVLLDRYK